MSFINSKLRYFVTCLIASSMLCALQDIFGQETLSLSVSGTPFELVWVPVDEPQGVNRIEIGDFSGKHPKEKKRSDSIYAPFESNGKRGYYLGKTEVTEEQWASVVGQGATDQASGRRENLHRDPVVHRQAERHGAQFGRYSAHA